MSKLFKVAIGINSLLLDAALDEDWDCPALQEFYHFAGSKANVLDKPSDTAVNSKII